MKEKRIIGIIMICSALLGTGCNQIKSSSGQPVLLNAEEVEQLFSNQTVESFNLNTGVTSFTYYAPNGSVRQERLWERRQGSWKVDDNRICLRMSKKPAKCRFIALKNGRYYKYRSDGSGKLEPILRYKKFMPGNVLSL